MSSDPIRWGFTPIEYHPEEEIVFPSGLSLDQIEDGEIVLDDKRGNIYYKKNNKMYKLRHNNTYQVLVSSDTYGVNLTSKQKYDKDMSFIRTLRSNNPSIIHTVGDIIIIKEVEPRSGETYPRYVDNVLDGTNEDLYDMRSYIRTDNVNKVDVNDTSYDSDSERAEWLPIGGGVKTKTSDTRLDEPLRVVTETTGDTVGGYKDFDFIPEGTSVYDILRRLLQKIIQPKVVKTPTRSGNYTINFHYNFYSFDEYYTPDISITPGTRFYLPWGFEYDHYQIKSVNTFVDGEYSFPTVTNGVKNTSKQKTGSSENTGSRKYKIYNNGSLYRTDSYSIAQNSGIDLANHSVPANSSNDRIAILMSYKQGVLAVNNAGEIASPNVRLAAGTYEQVIYYMNYYKAHAFICWNNRTPSTFSGSNASGIIDYLLTNKTGILNKVMPGVKFDSNFKIIKQTSSSPRDTSQQGLDYRNNYEIVAGNTYEYTVKKGSLCVEFYIPYGYTIKEIINPDMMNKDVLNLFSITNYASANIGNVGEAEQHNLGYRKYVYKCDIPFEKDVTFKVKYNEE